MPGSVRAQKEESDRIAAEKAAGDKKAIAAVSAAEKQAANEMFPRPSPVQQPSTAARAEEVERSPGGTAQIGVNWQLEDAESEESVVFDTDDDIVMTSEEEEHDI